MSIKSEGEGESNYDKSDESEYENESDEEGAVGGDRQQSRYSKRDLTEGRPGSNRSNEKGKHSENKKRRQSSLEKTVRAKV